MFTVKREGSGSGVKQGGRKARDMIRTSARFIRVLGEEGPKESPQELHHQPDQVNANKRQESDEDTGEVSLGLGSGEVKYTRSGRAYDPSKPKPKKTIFLNSKTVKPRDKDRLLHRQHPQKPHSNPNNQTTT